MRDLLPYQEEDALKRILRHHGVTVTREAIVSLSQFINWIRECEAAKGSFKAMPPMPLLSFLGQLGIYGKEMVDKVKMDA
jgi:hypothetical protein